MAEAADRTKHAPYRARRLEDLRVLRGGVVNRVTEIEGLAGLIADHRGTHLLKYRERSRSGEILRSRGVRRGGLVLVPAWDPLPAPTSAPKVGPPPWRPCEHRRGPDIVNGCLSR